jgi:alpha-N-arabinofuranosidase
MRVAALSVLSLRLTAAAAAPATFTVTSSAPEHLISPNLYSIFFETEINFGSEGGLYAELIHNRDFERLGRDKWGGDRADLAGMSAIERAFAPADPEAPGLDPHEPPAIPTDYSPWKPVGRAVLAVENGSAPFATNPHSLLLRGGESDGISNPGYWGLGVRPGVAFNLSLYAQVLSPVPAGGVRFNASVRCADGSTVSSVLVGAGSGCGGRQWCLLNASLPPPARACRGERDGGSFELALTQGATEVRLDGVSLRHADAVDGLFRRDVFEKVRAMRPGFVRSPGGNSAG